MINYSDFLAYNLIRGLKGCPIIYDANATKQDADDIKVIDFHSTARGRFIELVFKGCKYMIEVSFIQPVNFNVINVGLPEEIPDTIDDLLKKGGI